jgi:small subunit ribosomal protein S18
MQCYFCQNNIKKIDFKNTEMLSKFTSEMHKIRPKRKTGVCSTHQRKLAQAVKRARYMALLSYTNL